MEKNKHIETLTVELRELKGLFELKQEQWQEKDSIYLQRLSHMGKQEALFSQKNSEELQLLNEKIKFIT